LIGKNFTTLKYLHNPVTIIGGSPATGDMGIEKIMFSTAGIGPVQGVDMAMKYCFKVGLLVKKIY
jgi:hypothetical protein